MNEYRAFYIVKVCVWDLSDTHN